MLSSSKENLNQKHLIHFEDRELWFAQEKPTNYWSIAKKVLKRFTVPPILLWDGLKWAVNALAGEAMGRRILPAASDPELKAFLQGYAGDKALKQTILEILEKIPGFPYQNLTLKPITLTTEKKDGAKLDSLQFSYSEQLRQSEEYIIYFRGNGECYEHPDAIKEMLNDAIHLKCNVIGFNFRGVNNSRGKPKYTKNKEKVYLNATSRKDLINDGIAQVQRLLDAGVPPENITLKGHSLGAAIATQVAKHFHKPQYNMPINLFNGRSFSTTTHFAVGHIRAAGENRYDKKSLPALLKKNVFILLGHMAMPFIKLGLALTKWEINAASAFKKLPKTHKEYMLVRSSKKARNPESEENKTNSNNIPMDDTVIPHYASLHRDNDLREETRKLKKQNRKIIYINNKMENSIRNNGHIISDIQKLESKHIKLENKLSNSRKMTVDTPNTEGHRASFDELADRYQQQSANQFFYGFFNRIRKHKKDCHPSKLTCSEEDLSQVNLFENNNSREY